VNDLIQKDKELVVFLNSFNSIFFDNFCLFVTKQIHWTPIFLLFFYLLYRKIGWKKLGIALLFISFILMVCDQTTNLFKFSFERLRPINDLDIKDNLRVLIRRSSYSFFSGHASNSMATTLFLFLIFRKHYKYGFLLFLFPLIFAYSRVHLALHFPSDILAGYFFGTIVGLFFYLLYKKYNSDNFKNKNKFLILTTVFVLLYFVILKFSSLKFQVKN